MSTLLSTAVSVNEFGYEGNTSSKRWKWADVTLTLTGQGSLTDPIPAALFGMSSIVGARFARDSNNNIVPASASYDGSTVLLGASAAGATKNIVATGLASAGNITATGVLATDKILSVTDLTTPASLNPANFTPGAGVIAQASGAGDIHTLKLQILLQAAATSTTGVTGTVRLIVVGNE